MTCNNGLRCHYPRSVCVRTAPGNVNMVAYGKINTRLSPSTVSKMAHDGDVQIRQSALYSLYLYGRPLTSTGSMWAPYLPEKYVGPLPPREVCGPPTSPRSTWAPYLPEKYVGPLPPREVCGPLPPRYVHGPHLTEKYVGPLPP